MKARVLEEVLHPTVKQRIEQAEAIWDSVAEDTDAAALPVSAADRAELDRRLSDLEVDPDAGSSWDEVPRPSRTTASWRRQEVVRW